MLRWRWTVGDTEVDVDVFRSRRGGWRFGLALERERHPREDLWSVTLGPLMVNVGAGLAMTEERLRAYCAQRNVAYITPTKGEGAERARDRRAFLVAKLTPRQHRRIRHKGPSWSLA